MKKSSKVLWIFSGLIFAIILILSVLRSAQYSSNRHIASPFSFNLFGVKKITGNKNITSKSAALTDFDTINAAEDFEVTFNPGTQNTAVITSDENILPYINITQEKHTLFLNVQSGVSISPSTTDKAIITSSTMLHRINLNGFASIQAMNLNSNELTLNIHGMSSGDIQGSIKQIRINLSGKSVLHLKVPDADSIVLDTHGMGTVYLSGNTKNLNIISSGKASILAHDLIADEVVITSSGMSNINIHAVKSLSISTSGKSNIKYSGNPNISRNALGDSTVEKISK